MSHTQPPNTRSPYVLRGKTFSNVARTKQPHPQRRHTHISLGTVTVDAMPPPQPEREGEAAVSITTLEPGQLLRLREGLQADLQRLADYGNTMQKIGNTLLTAKSSIEALGQSKEGRSVGPSCHGLPGVSKVLDVGGLTCQGARHVCCLPTVSLGRALACPPPCGLLPTCGPAGQPMLLPLTSSLYVNGEVGSSKDVLVDIGTGYYVEVGQRRWAAGGNGPADNVKGRGPWRAVCHSVGGGTGTGTRIFRADGRGRGGGTCRHGRASRRQGASTTRSGCTLPLWPVQSATTKVFQSAACS